MAKRNHLFVLVLAPIALLALAVLSLWLFEGESALPDLPRDAGIPKPAEAIDPACPEVGGPGAGRPEPVGGERAEQADRVLVRAPSGPEAPLLEVEVYFLENEQEQKAAGARVVVWSECKDHEPDPGSAEAAPRSGPDERSPWAAEREFICDAEGRVFLPLGAMAGPVGKQGAAFHIQAWTRDRRHASGSRPYGCTVALDRYGRIRRTAPIPFTGPVQKIRLELHPNQSLTVFVHDGEGRGLAGIPVQLFNPFRGLGSSGAKRSPDPIPVLPRGSTDHEGKFTFAVPLCKDFQRIQHILFAGFAFPLADQSRWFRKVTEEHFAGKEVELELPPTGSVEVEIDGGPESGWKSRAFWVQVEDAAGMGKRGGFMESLRSRRIGLSGMKKTQGHRAVFDLVGLDLELDVTGIMEGTWRASTRTVLGPTVPGERVRVVLAPPGPDPLVSGVLLDLDGRPLADARLEVHGGGGSHATIDLRVQPLRVNPLGRVRTDAMGQFWVALPPPFVNGVLKQLRLVPVNHILDEWPPSCVIDLPPPFTEGTHFLGKHKLERPPILAKGTVVGQDGFPVEGVDVLCLMRARPDRDQWLPNPSCRTVTDHEGRWSIHGHLPPGEFMVEAFNGKEFRSRRVAALPGSDGLILVLAENLAGGLEARLLVDHPSHLERGMIRVELIPKQSAPEGSGAGPRSGTRAPGGSMTWSGLLAGLYEFRVSVIGDPAEPLALVTGLRVEAGQVNDELAQKPVDLRGRTEVVRLVAKLPSGEAVPARRLWVKDAPGSRIDSEGSGVLFLKRTGEAPVVEVVPLEEPGFSFMPARVRCTGTEVEVVLQPKPAGPSAGGGDGK